MKKKIISVTLALLLCVGLAVPAFAENPPGINTIPSVTVKLPFVSGLTATMTNVHDKYVKNPNGSVTFSFETYGGAPDYEDYGDKCTVSFNQDVVLFKPEEDLHMASSEFPVVTLKAGEIYKLDIGFFILTDDGKILSEIPDWDENGDWVDYEYKGMTFDPIPMSLGHAILGDDEYEVAASISDISVDSAAPVTPPTPPTSALVAKPTASTVLVNGKNVAFDAYNIGGSNYFKLRDLAYALNGTNKQFEVGYDGATKAVTLTSGKAYTPVGGELAAGDGGEKNPAPTQSAVYKDGEKVSCEVYNIGGNNYFKLRDVLKLFDIGVSYNANTKRIEINTNEGYTE